MKECSIGHVQGEVETAGDQDGCDNTVKTVDMQLSQSCCPLSPIIERHSIVHAWREVEGGMQQQEGRGEEEVVQVIEQPSQSSEPVQRTVDLGIVVQRLDDLVERFTHLEQMTEARDRTRSSEFQFLCSEFFTLSLHLGYAANASKPPIPPSQDSTTKSLKDQSAEGL